MLLFGIQPSEEQNNQTKETIPGQFYSDIIKGTGLYLIYTLHPSGIKTSKLRKQYQVCFIQI